jgi:RNA polymerase sigma-54 factor
VRQRLADLLAMPAFAALSDARLAAILEQEGLGVARRTVAKYRAALQRPPRRA